VGKSEAAVVVGSAWEAGLAGASKPAVAFCKRSLVGPFVLLACSASTNGNADEAISKLARQTLIGAVRKEVAPIASPIFKKDARRIAVSRQVLCHRSLTTGARLPRKRYRG